jgi:plastocyanin
MRKLIATLTVVSLLAGLAAVAALATTPKVSWHIGTSKTVKIHKGQKVTWVWTGDAAHNVKGKGFKSSIKSARGATYSHTFRTRGKYTIVCTLHPGAMKTVVKVS